MTPSASALRAPPPPGLGQALTGGLDNGSQHNDRGQQAQFCGHLPGPRSAAAHAAHGNKRSHRQDGQRTSPASARNQARIHISRGSCAARVTRGE